MAQSPQNTAEAGKPTPQPTPSLSKDAGNDAGTKTISARVFTDFAAI